MSETTEGRSAVGRIRGRKRGVAIAVGGTFWVWLLARWAAHNTLLDWLLSTLGLPNLVRSERGVSQRDPWLPVEWLGGVANDITASAASGGLDGALAEQLVWPVELVILAGESEPALAAGAFVTVYLTVASMFFGLFIAVPTAVTRVYGGSISSRLSLAYTELIRGTPLLAQLFFFYFGLPLAGLISDIPFMELDGMPRSAAIVAIVAFTINSGAYQAEYIRSALQSVDPGQLTAARAIGLSRMEGIRHVVLPQGLRYAIPGWTNEFVYLLKYSSLAAFITVPELFYRADQIASETFRYTLIFVVTGVTYLALVLTASELMARVEDAVAIPGLGVDREE